MTDEIEFLKNEVARLRAEQIIEENPIIRLSLEKKINEASAIIEKFDTKNPSVRNEIPRYKPENIQKTPKTGVTKKRQVKPAGSEKQSIENKGMSLIKIAETVIAGVLVLVVAWVVAHYFGVTL